MVKFWAALFAEKWSPKRQNFQSMVRQRWYHSRATKCSTIKNGIWPKSLLITVPSNQDVKSYMLN